jgi:L-ribulose-5-phosphate 4-epimerase
MGQWREAKKTVLEAAREMVQKGLVTGTAGNISLRLAPEGKHHLLAITPSSRHYDAIGIDDIQVMDFNGEKVEGDLLPSIETPMHTAIYKARKDVNAVIHTHSTYASAAAVAGLDIPAIIEEQVICLGGGIKLAEYALCGSVELAKNAVAALEDRSGVLLASHGAIGTGRSMRDAFTACELVEKTAKIYILALLAGKVNTLPDKSIESGKKLYYHSRTDPRD